MPFSWQVGVMLVAGSIMLALSCISQTQRKILVANPFSLACFLAGLWCFLYSWQLQSVVLTEKIFILKIGFSVVSLIPVLSLEFTYRFVHERRLLRGWTLLAALIIPIATVGLAWTIGSNHLFRYDFWLDTSKPLAVLRYKTGPWNTIFFVYVYVLAVWSFWILLHSLRSAPPWVRRARLLVLLARLIPLFFNVLYQFRILPPEGLNYAPASLALTDIIIAIILFGDRFGYRVYFAHSALVEKISDLLIVLDHRRRILDMNRAALSTLNVRLEAVQGQPARELFAAWPEILPHLDDGPDQVSELEYRGRSFELTVISTDEQKKDAPFILWLRDISRRKRAELDHIAASASAREATLAKERYLAVMSHEIRSPLNSVLGFMRLLETTSLDREQTEYISHISRSGDSLLSLINEVLDYSKVEAGRMALAADPFDLRAEVISLCAIMEHEAKAKGIAFQCWIAPEVPPVLIGDKLRIVQILRNLISNAIKFTTEGQITVDVAVVPSPAPLSQCQLRLTITDTGIGIAPGEVASLFQPFSQASGAIQHRYGGTGLGLVIAKRFSELMGGSISVQSAFGEGSVFTCHLTLAVGQAPSRASSPSQTHVVPSLRILVVDDQLVNRRLLQLMLGRLHHQTTVASDGGECLRLLREHDYDVIIMDVEMPGLDGFETTRQIRRQNFNHHIIALTAHASMDIREQCLSSGMSDYLAKPVTLAALESALASASAKRNI